ncbi:MAG: dihydrofolate reductase [Patescibacteria group bacterium]
MRGGTPPRGGGVGSYSDKLPPLAPPHTRGRNSLTIIVAVAKNNVIGSNGIIPWNIPEEMALFKSITMGHPVIVGRKTFDSIGHELPGRENIVLSKSGEINCIEKALEQTKEKQAFVIGGASVYAQMMPFVDQMRISHLKKAYEGDALFPKIDRNIWRITKQQEFSDFIHSTYTRI